MLAQLLTMTITHKFPLQDSFQEFQQLQDRIKKEQNSSSSPFGGMPTALGADFLPSSSRPLPSFNQACAIKLEPPLEMLADGNGVDHDDDQHPVLKQFLTDTTFQTKYNLKPYNFAGLAEGFVIDSGGGGGSISDGGGLPSSGGMVPSSGGIVPSSGGGMPTPTPDGMLTAIKNSGGAATAEEKSGKTTATTATLELEDVKPVLDLAFQQFWKDIETTCEILSIPRGKTFFYHISFNI